MTRARYRLCVADTNDGQLVVNFKACVIAAGGFGANRELLKKYYPKQFSGGGKFHSLCPPSLTGDCILAAEEIGAYIDPTIRSTIFPGRFYGRRLYASSLESEPFEPYERKVCND